MFDNNDPLCVEYLDGRNWRLHEDFSYFDEVGAPGDEDGTLIEVPAGFVTDFASIPKALWSYLPPTGKYGKAAVIHDWLYRGGKPEGREVTKAYADAVFERAMKELGVPWLRRKLMYLAVRVAGRGVWGKERAL